MSRRIGRRVGKYRLLEVLGSGAFGMQFVGLGRVYRAQHIESNQSFAIKAIPKQKAIGDRALSSITSEILNMVSCDHPHIVGLEEAFSTRKSLYLVMELVDGMDFVDRINTKKCTEDEARKYFKQLCQAIKYLKERRIAHRDIKPENILVDKNDNIKLVDFGLSTFFQNCSRIFESEVSNQCGTLQYLAPEIIRKEKYEPHAADVWSMGVVLYCILAGKSPFFDENVNVLMHNIINPHIQFDFQCSDDFKGLIVSILHPNPLKRPTVECIIKHPWLQKMGGKLTPLYRDTLVYETYTEGSLHCQLQYLLLSRIGGLELTLALYKLALAKTMSGRRNCLLAKHTTLQHLNGLLTRFHLKLTVQNNRFTYTNNDPKVHIELYRINDPSGMFLLKIDTKSQEVFDELQTLLSLHS